MVEGHLSRARTAGTAVAQDHDFIHRSRETTPHLHQQIDVPVARSYSFANDLPDQLTRLTLHYIDRD